MWNAASTCRRRRAYLLLLVSALIALAVSATANGGRKPKSDIRAPSAPTGLKLSGATGTSFTLSWSASKDNVGVAGYEIYLNNSKVGATGAKSYGFSGLPCSTSYTVAVDAYDAAGNRSSRTAVQASTSPCTDKQAPTMPLSVVETTATVSSIAVSWQASVDNVGVAGYDVYLNGNQVATTAATSYGFSGLSCGQSYALAVDAYDAAGNRSPQASVRASSSSCPDTQAPTTPLFLVETSATTSTISVSWQSSLDNVGVAGYTVYANGNKAGTTALALYSVGSLGCGQSYTLSVDAYDAAGNHSPQTAVVASTAPCPPPPSSPAPSPPACNFTLSAGQSLPSASAGQTICLHGGTYSGGITYGSSGTAGSPITIKSYPGETALISGPSGGTALKVNGSYVKLDSLRVDNALYGIDVVGDGVEVANSTVLHAGFGIFTEASADKTYVHDSTFTDNNRMIVNTLCSVNCNDDYGAQAFEISGTNGHFSHNTVTGSWSVSSDYGHDGDVFEIWGGSGNLIDYNFGQNNGAFAELGKPSTRTCDNNHFYYNVVISSLPFGVDGIDAHGNEGFGPCNGTQLYNNSILISSPTSEPLRCGSCTATMMTLRNNAVRATGAGDVYNLSGSNEDYDILSGVGAPSAHGAHTITSDPLFVSATNLDTQTSSPARGAGTLVGLTSDFLSIPVPGGAATDIGAFEH